MNHFKLLNGRASFVLLRTSNPQILETADKKTPRQEA